MMTQDYTADTPAMLTDGETLRLAASIVAAYVGRNSIQPSEVAGLIQTVYSALCATTAGEPAPAPVEALKPAVPVKKSIGTDYIICLEDGKKLKMLKRHLRTTYGLSPEEYRTKWNLPADYPMVAPAYAAQRSEFAKKIGLGLRPAARKPARAPRKAAPKG